MHLNCDEISAIQIDYMNIIIYLLLLHKPKPNETIICIDIIIYDTHYEIGKYK